MGSLCVAPSLVLGDLAVQRLELDLRSSTLSEEFAGLAETRLAQNTLNYIKRILSYLELPLHVLNYLNVC